MTTRFNIVDAILRETLFLAEKTALIDGGCTLTYGQLSGAVSRLAQELAQRGVGPLDRVAFLCADSIDYVLLSLAVLSRDAAIIPIAPGLMSDEREALVERMDVHHVLSEAAASPSAAPSALHTGDLTRTFTLVSRSSGQPAPEGYAALRPAFIRFSSGTTGMSKGVALSHETIRDRTDAANKGLCVTADDVVGWVLSMSFHFVVTILLFLRKGATIILCGEPMPNGLFEALRRHPITLLYASPIHYRLLTGSRTLPAKPFASLRMAISTAIKLPAQIARDFFERFGVRLTEAYGIIEVGLPFIHIPEQSHDGLLGKPLPDYRVKLGTDGEVLIQGKGMFDAYFSPWQPRAVCQPDGWFHTGDVGELSADGSLRLVGRCKAVINFSGMKIFPQEVEDVINLHPAVLESLVYGEPHPEYGQIPCAKIVLKDGVTGVDEAALRAFCRARLAVHKIPKTFARVDDLPKTASGKIRRT